MKVKVSNVNQPVWKECNVHATLPAELSKLQELAYNVWWSWNGEAKDLFRYIDTDAWKRANSNPIVLLNILSYDRMVELSKDEVFMAKLNKVYDEFRAYMDAPKDKRKGTVKLGFLNPFLHSPLTCLSLPVPINQSIYNTGRRGLRGRSESPLIL